LDTAKKLILVVIDGLTPAVFEDAVGTGAAPALAFLAEHGTYNRGVSTFPSLTPVCLSSIATGSHPDVHQIPHLVWYHREEQRVVEYGSSFAAIRAAGTRQAILDAIFNMNEQHLGRRAMTAYGPKRFFFYNLFESDVTGAPVAVFGRSAGSIDAYAAAVGRWLVTRDGFDFLLYYLPDYDFASHERGPEETQEALTRSDAAIGALIEAAGGPEEFLERYAVVVCSDHGQTRVDRAASLHSRFADLPEVVVTASNRAGMVYRLPACKEDAAALAGRLEGEDACEVVLYREDGEAVARRDGEELRFAPANGGWRTNGDASLLDQPDALERAWAALANPNAGDVIVSAAIGYEFTDLAGRSHLGGGSHGSLEAGDSEVPILTVGMHAPEPRRIVDLAPLALGHFDG
jgi:predicted AlkP superfamily pyrophosphatase or phosphodiesterase